MVKGLGWTVRGEVEGDNEWEGRGRGEGVPKWALEGRVEGRKENARGKFKEERTVALVDGRNVGI